MGKDVAFKNRDRFIELGLTISALRKMKGLSQEALAERANISRSHLSAIEAPNIVRPFSVEVLFNIADALEVNAGDLLNARFPNPGKHPKKIEPRQAVRLLRFFSCLLGAQKAPPGARRPAAQKRNLPAAGLSFCIMRQNARKL